MFYKVGIFLISKAVETAIWAGPKLAQVYTAASRRFGEI